MIRIIIEAVGEDFETADKILKKTLERGTDSIGDVTGSSMVDVVECNDFGLVTKKLIYSKLVKDVAERNTFTGAHDALAKEANTLAFLGVARLGVFKALDFIAGLFSKKAGVK